MLAPGLSAQVTLRTDVVRYASDFPKDSLPAIYSRLQVALNKYNQYATVFDSAANKVNSKSLESYGDLFNTGAEVLNELIDLPEVINASDYASTILETFPQTGLKYEITSAMLDEVRYDSAGYFLAEVIIRKRVFNQIKGASRKVVLTTNGRCFIDTIKYDVPFNSDRVKIQKVLGHLDANCPPIRSPQTPKTVYLGPEARFGRSLVNADFQGFLNNSSRTSYFGNTTLDAGPTIGMGVRLQCALNSKQSMYFTLGLGYSRMGLTASVDSLHYRFEHKDIDGDNYEHDVRLSQVREQIALSGMELSPGISIQLWGDKQITLLADVALLLRFASAKGELDAEASYRGYFGQWQWIAYAKEFDPDYGFTDYAAQGLAVTYDRQLATGLRLAPNLLYRTKNNLLLTAGFEYDFFFGSAMPNSTLAEGEHILRFKGTQEKKTEGIGFNYLTNVRYARLGLRIGALFPLSKKTTNKRK